MLWYHTVDFRKRNTTQGKRYFNANKFMQMYSLNVYAQNHRPLPDT